MARGGTWSCLSDTGAALCSAKAQGEVCNCEAQSRPRPSDCPKWCPWCRCEDWKSWRLLDKTATAVSRDSDCHCPEQGCHCHNNLYKGTTWCTCKPQAAEARRSTEEIQEVPSSFLKPWFRPFYRSCSMAKEAGKATTARTTLSTMAREETSGKTREENPGTARGAAYVGITLQVRTGRK